MYSYFLTRHAEFATQPFPTLAAARKAGGKVACKAGLHAARQ